MNLDRKIATVFGGTGFIGRHVVQRLAKAGYTVKVATRIPEHAFFLKPLGTVGQIAPVPVNYNDPRSIAAAVAGADLVVNCVGILFEKKRNAFRRLHTEVPRTIAAACSAAHVRLFIHVSALGVDRSKSKYARSKFEGEKNVMAVCPRAVILRPSVVFGTEDKFFNMFAELSRFAPALPLIGGGHTRFQPVFVGDVADAVMVAALRPDVVGHIFELGGPETVTFRQLLERLFKYTKRPRPLISVPFFASKIDAWFLGFLPNPPLTPDQVESLKTDNIVSGALPSFIDLGITPTSMSLILPSYLEHYRSGGIFGGKKSQKAA